MNTVQHSVKRKILLNPGPATTSQGVKDALVVSDICPREKEFGDLIEGICHDLARVVGAEQTHRTVLFGGSGTAAMEAAISSLPPRDGQILIIENGAYGKRFKEIADVYNINTLHYKIPYGEHPDTGEIEKLLQANPGIGHVFLIHHETTTGILNPVSEIAAIAHKYKAELVLDAMSSYAGIPIHLGEMGVDYILSSSNKCIQGMAGLSFVICPLEKLESKSGHRRSYYLDLFAQYEAFRHTRQVQFTPPVQVCYSLRQALDEYFAEGEAGRVGRYRKNFETLYAGLQKIGFRFLLPPEQESGILTAILEPRDENYNFDEMHDYLYERGYTIYPGKGAAKETFRLAILGDLTPTDIESFLAELANYVNQAGIKKF